MTNQDESSSRVSGLDSRALQCVVFILFKTFHDDTDAFVVTFESILSGVLSPPERIMHIVTLFHGSSQYTF